MGINEDGELIVESIVKYAERAATGEAKISEMESRLSSIEQPPKQRMLCHSSSKLNPNNSKPCHESSPQQPQQQWKQQKSNKKRETPKNLTGYTQHMQFGKCPNVYQPQQGQQTGGHQAGGAYTHHQKTQLNLYYCFPMDTMWTILAHTASSRSKATSQHGAG